MVIHETTEPRGEGQEREGEEEGKGEEHTEDSGSQKLHHFSEKCLTSHLHSSVSRGFRTKNSSAIDRAAAARSESDEFFVLNPLVIEQGLIQCLKPPKRRCTFWDPESPADQER